MAIVILPDSTRIDLLDDMARELYGIADPGAPLDSTSDTYRWRWLVDELVQEMSEDKFRDALDYMARAHDVDVIELDAVEYTIMDALGCTVTAAQGLREWVFNGSIASLAQLRADLTEFAIWYPDDDALAADSLVYYDGELYETVLDGKPVRVEANVWYDMSWGYLVMYH